MDETGRRVLAGRKAHYAKAARGHVTDCDTETRVMSKNEIEVWRSAADARAARELTQAETQRIVAENALGIQEQVQAEADRKHERALETQRLENDHELAKMSTMDVEKETSRELKIAEMRHSSALSLQRGWIKGLIWGTPAGLAVGFGAGLAIGLLF